MDNQDNKSQTSQQSHLQMMDEEDYTIFQDPTPPEYSNEPNPPEDHSEIQILQESLKQKRQKMIQLIYIAKYSPQYRKSLQKIAYDYGCDLSFGKNSFTISSKDKSNLQRWTICKELINQQFDKILYKIIDDNEKKFKLYNSPEVNRFANQMGIYFSKFNQEIYLHSDKYTQKQLDQKKVEICNYCNIFTVCFCRKKTLQTIDLLIAKFYRTVLEEYYKERFDKKNLFVQINKLDRTFYILGRKGSTQHMMMQAKKTMRSLIQGITIIAFKNIELNSKAQIKLNDYLKKISNFPVIYGKLSQSVIVLISKDNILKQLLQKTQKISQKLCINDHTQMGIYLPFCFSKDQKRQQIHKICKQMGYDFQIIWGIRYFRPMIASENDVKNPNEIIQLITRIINGFCEVKDKHEIIKEKDEPENKVDIKKKKQLQGQDKYSYILKNAPKDSIQLTKALRRDTMEDQVLMKKKYNVIYSLMEGKQIGPYYIDQVQYDKGVNKSEIKLIELVNLKKGQYFEVYLKLADEYSSKQRSITELEDFLLQELRRLKKAAKEKKQEGLDSERKISHMIKKLINVF